MIDIYVNRKFQITKEGNKMAVERVTVKLGNTSKVLTISEANELVELLESELFDERTFREMDIELAELKAKVEKYENIIEELEEIIENLK